MMVRRLADRSLLWNLAFDAILLCVLVVAVVNQFELRNEVHARQNASYRNCQASNDSRHVLANVLMAAETLIRKSPTATPEQKHNAIEFYKGQIDNIRYSDCSVYRS